MSETQDSVSVTSSSGETVVVHEVLKEGQSRDTGWVCPEWQEGAGLFVFRSITAKLAGRRGGKLVSERERKVVCELLDALEQAVPIDFGQVVKLTVVGETVALGRWPEGSFGHVGAEYVVRW